MIQTEIQRATTQLKSRLSIKQVAEDIGLEAGKSGLYHCFNDAAHGKGDGKPSLKIYDNHFKCFGGTCDAKGDVFNLYQQATNTSFTDTVKELAAKYAADLLPAIEANQKQPFKGRQKTLKRVKPMKERIRQQKKQIAPVVSPPSPVSLDIYQSFAFFNESQGRPNINEAGRQYLSSRAFDPDRVPAFTVDDYAGVSKMLRESFSADDLKASGLFNDKGNLTFYKHRLIFASINDEGRINYLQGRRLSDDKASSEYADTKYHCLPSDYVPLFLVPYLDDGKLETAFEKARRSESQNIYLTEGVPDLLAIAFDDAPAVGIIGTNQASPAQFRRHLHLFEGLTPIICFDGDDAGRKAAESLAKLFFEEAEVIAKVYHPPNGKDISDQRTESQ